MKIHFSIRRHFLLLMVFALLKAGAFAQLQADFSTTTVSGCPPLVVSFKDSSSGNPTLWEWDLGNGTKSYLKDPTTTYLNSGSYDVKLVVKNEDGADSILKRKLIIVNAIPVAKFGSSQTGGCFPLDVQFKDSSLAGSGTLASWKWDFGDGTLSNVRNPHHLYTQAGNFTVVLQVTNSNGCTDVITKSDYIRIQNGVKADYNYISQGSCNPPEAVVFNNTSAGTGALSYNWDFGDGTKSGEKDPTHTYRATGVYTIKLIASNSTGCSDTLVKPNAISIGSVRADFTIPDTICADRDFVLKNTSSPSSFVGSSWNFGDHTFSDSTNPVKKYSDAGVYRVKLITDFGACKDSVDKDLTVLAQPTVSFTATNNTSCGAPLTVSFNNTSTSGISYLWDFGDNTTSTLKNPSHVYKKSGEYSVTLTVKNASGCSATGVDTGIVKIIPPKITSIENLPLKGCAPSTATPVAVIKNGVDGMKYLWNFGDGTTSTDPSPSHTYITSGNFDIKLTITTPTGCMDTLTVVKAAQIGTKPKAQFFANPLDVCAKSSVNFTDTSTGPTATSWFWRFGDGGTSTSQNHAHVYNSPGKFTVTLVVSNYGCSDTLSKISYINVRPPLANFDTAFICDDPLKRSFIDKSTGAKTWLWDFGDGSTSADQIVSHTYAAVGTYPVVLKVTNGNCEQTLKKDIVVIDEKGIFKTSTVESCANTSILLKVLSVDSSHISSYNWYSNGFLGAGIQNTQNPFSYSYDSAGIKNPVVVVTDILGCPDTLKASTPVTIYGPKAGFGSLNAKTCFGNTVNFIDSTLTDGTHAIKQWVWDFGEGTAKNYSAGPFSHNYLSPGTYNVKLSVKDSYGCKDSLIKMSYISVTKPVAKFIPSDSVLCAQSSITFKNYSEGVGGVYHWDFGDGETSSEFEPVHTFRLSGIYMVRMTIVDSNGCTDSARAKIRISTAIIDFSLSDTFSTCPPLTVTATNHSSTATYNWDFGDGGSSQLVDPSHIYTYPGVYNIKLKISTAGGCIDSLKRQVVVQGPTAVLDYTPKEACNHATVTFSLQSQKAVSYIWDYSDGTTIFSDKNVTTHTYNAPGIYIPKIILQDSNKCKVPLPPIDTIKVDGIETYFNSTSRQLCDSGYIKFNDSTVSNVMVNSWAWDFGDGFTSTNQFPNHKFTDTGFYTISLISKTKFGCADTAITQKYIKVVSSPVVKITGDTATCQSGQIKLQGEFVRTDTSAVKWNWNFGNGKTSSSQVPEAQTYTTAGVFPVIAKAINTSGCYDSVVQTVTIHPKPTLNAGADTAICKFTNAKLHATGAATYNWTAEPSLSCTNCANPIAKPGETTTYHLTGKSTYGCTNEDSLTVTVQQPFKITVEKNDTVCLGSTITLRATGADKFEWSPAKWLDNPNSATPKSTPSSSITYKVVGKDNLGCFKDEGQVNVKVYTKPQTEITNGDNIVVPAGGNIKLSTKNSPDVINWKWFPSQGLGCNSCAETVAAPTDNITYSVVASNQGHCEARDEVTITVFCNNANVYVPNTFSPNHDGSNDVFYPRGTGLYTIKSFKIFNRWGQMVFSKNAIKPNDPQGGWDGTLNGALLQPDVYVYFLEVICSNNVTLPIKGNVALIR